MVVYGEGRYVCGAHDVVAAGPRQPAALAAGRFEPPCPRCGAALTPELVGEDAPLDPRNVYAATKVAQEHLAGAWARVTGASVAALRYHNVYGARMPRDTPYAGVAALFRSALARGEAPRVFEDGGQRRDFVEVRDVAAANVAALERHEAPGVLRAFNVGSGRPRTVGELAAELARACGGPAPVVTGEFRLGDVRHVTASSERARRELGWSAAVEFDRGVAEFAAAPLRDPATGAAAGRPQPGDDSPLPERCSGADRRAVRGDQGVAGRLLDPRGESRPGGRDRLAGRRVHRVPDGDPADPGRAAAAVADLTGPG
jgi:dTDP-L-rhamnose 4-epimerase